MSLIDERNFNLATDVIFQVPISVISFLEFVSSQIAVNDAGNDTLEKYAKSSLLNTADSSEIEGPLGPKRWWRRS